MPVHSWLLLASLIVAAPRHHPHPHRLPHLMRPPNKPALHRHFAWVRIRTRTWRGKVYVDLGLLKRAEWIYAANGR